MMWCENDLLLVGEYAWRQWQQSCARWLTSSNNRLADMQPGFTVYFFDIGLWPIDTCQNKVSANEHHVTIIYCLSLELIKVTWFVEFTVDQMLGYNRIEGSLYEEHGWVNTNPGVRVNHFHCFFTAFAFVLCKSQQSKPISIQKTSP